MRPIRQAALTTVTSGAVIPMDWRGSDPLFTVGVVATATINYTVQYTLDDVFDPAFNPATATWYSVPAAALVTATATQSAVLNLPCTGIRLTVNSVTGGSAALTVVAANGPSA